jgi:pyruvate-formate lyase-activating enzyme
MVENGILGEIFPDMYLVACPISAETMPVLHAYPGETFFQISTLGCNLSCEGCISTVIVKEMDEGEDLLQHIPPEKVVDLALERNCRGVVFLMNDPLASYLTFTNVAKAAKARGLVVGCSTNGLFTKTSLKRLIPFLDFVNLGMKGIWDCSYESCGALGGAPVLENLKTLYENGVHVEVSCMMRTDNREELIALASYVASVSRSIPFQVMRFIPFENADITLEPTISKAEAFCAELREILDFVYLFNSPGTPLLDTVCPDCGNIALQREFYGPMGARLLTADNLCPADSHCPSCGRDLHITGKARAKHFTERGFEGGYPFTRALEMVQAMMIAMGLSNHRHMMKAWKALLRNGGLQKFHHQIQDPLTYVDTLRHFGAVCGRENHAETLAAYLEGKLAEVKDRLEGITERPKVYYAMGTPLFALNGGRMENRLVEYAGGESLNTRIQGEGRPGQTLTADRLSELNPDVIFISGFISEPAQEFYNRCLELGVTAEAVKNRRIFNHLAPGWDFGSPRWILGLMHIASVLHPERCDFDMLEEAGTFYRLFYGMDFSPSSVNRSFSRPSRLWRWNVVESVADPVSETA